MDLRNVRARPVPIAVLTWPNLLSSFRLALVPLQLYLAWLGLAGVFLTVFVVQVLSDFLDGFLARRLNQTSELGTKIDSWADLAMYTTIPLCGWWLWPDLVRREKFYLLVALIGYFLPIAFGFWKFGRLTSYHTWLSRLSVWLMAVALFLLFLGGPGWPFHVATVILLLSSLEEMVLTAFLRDWQANVPSIWHVMKLKEQTSPFIPETARKENSQFVRPRRRKLEKLFLVIAGLGLCGWILLHPERNLLHRATRLNIPSSLLTDDSFTYRWLSTNSIFAVREMSQDEYQPLKVDLPSGKTTPLPGLDALFQGHEKRSDTFRWALSPDASWILVQICSPSNSAYLASTLDGSGSLTRSSPGVRNQFMWMRNNQGWFELVEQRTNLAVRLHRLDTSECKEISVTLPPRSSSSSRYLLEAVTADGSLLAIESQSGNLSGIVELVQIDLGSNPARLMRLPAALPRRANLLDLFVSPDGERLGWLLSFQRSRLSEPRFAGHFPFVDFEKAHTSALWVSRIDGSEMREVGHLKLRASISIAGWTPDGQNFDFGYLNLAEDQFQLWTVPVE
jgi:CDP-diacylglycerol--glycerol-3-phosphate 3-phosphatidyltransferase